MGKGGVTKLNNNRTYIGQTKVKRAKGISRLDWLWITKFLFAGPLYCCISLSKGRASDKSIIFWSWILRLECCNGSCFETVYQRWKCIDLLVLTSNNTRIKKRAAVINCQRRSLSSQKITVCRMIQSEINSLHRQRHRNKLFVPSKFHHSLQKILIRPLPEVSHYCTSENGQCHSQRCECCV